jgi:hypothetical protein
MNALAAQVLAVRLRCKLAYYAIASTEGRLVSGLARTGSIPLWRRGDGQAHCDRERAVNRARLARTLVRHIRLSSRSPSGLYRNWPAQRGHAADNAASGDLEFGSREHGLAINHAETIALPGLERFACPAAQERRVDA